MPYDVEDPYEYVEAIPFYGRLPELGEGETSILSPVQTFSNPPDSPWIGSDKQKVLDEKCTLQTPPKDRHSIPSDIAFGDGDGTSAYVNENGELISIVQMLNMGPSGLFRARANFLSKSEADHPFNGIVRGNRSGIGLSLIRDNLFDHGSHQIDFVHDRWPRISSQSEKLDLEIQLAIKDRRVIQHYILRGKDRVHVKFAFDAAFIVDEPYQRPQNMRPTCYVDGGIFTTGATAIALAGGPGGHVRFLASLFKDAKPVTLDLSFEPASLTDEVPYIVPDPSAKINCDLRIVSSLTQEHELELLEGETRTMTAIYYFECEEWKRDEVYSMHLMPEASVRYNEKNHRKREEEFMKEYNKAKNSDHNDRVRSLFGQGMPIESAHDLEEMEKKDFEQHDEQKCNTTVPFSNWGGENMSPERLLGVEWHTGSFEEDFLYWGYLDEGSLEVPRRTLLLAFNEAFAQIRKRIGQDHDYSL
ncbi:MAG: hypothetical protein Q9191_006513 [Dirinaria sp. TL-2023a]